MTAQSAFKLPFCNRTGVQKEHATCQHSTTCCTCSQLLGVGALLSHSHATGWSKVSSSPKESVRKNSSRYLFHHGVLSDESPLPAKHENKSDSSMLVAGYARFCILLSGEERCTSSDREKGGFGAPFELDTTPLKMAHFQSDPEIYFQETIQESALTPSTHGYIPLLSAMIASGRSAERLSRAAALRNSLRYSSATCHIYQWNISNTSGNADSLFGAMVFGAPRSSFLRRLCRI